MSENKTTIFIGTQDMEERYGEELYKEYLEKENERLKDVINKAIEYIDNNYPLRTSFSKNIYDFKIEIKKILRGENNG